MQELELTTSIPENVVIYNWFDYPIIDIMETVHIIRTRSGAIFDVPCAFDIETTTITHREQTHSEPPSNTSNNRVSPSHETCMYNWQLCIGETVCMGRTWEEWLRLYKRLLDYASGVANYVIYCHLLAYEFQHLRRFHRTTSIFCRKARVPIYWRIQGIEFRCSYLLSNMSLEGFCSKYKVAHHKQGKYDYTKLRYPHTSLTAEELTYCYCDVRGLCECIYAILDDYGDTLETIPLTSTGYVRREARKACLSDTKHHALIERLALTPAQYTLCKDAFRGGDTAANAVWCNQTLDDVESFDMQSSYPAVIMSEKFPMTKFKEVALSSLTRKRFDDYTSRHACLFRIILRNIQVRTSYSTPYIAIAKCLHSSGVRKFNGRILSAKYIEIAITDIDWKIISNDYTFDSAIQILEFHYARYGYLPDTLRGYLADMFYQKCLLKEKLKREDATALDYMLYNKYKNKINAMFGMMVTDIASPDIIYDSSSDDKLNATIADSEWSEEDNELSVMLRKYYKNSKSFLAYQWGVWVTAHGRSRLREGIDIVGHDLYYTDTDSVKCPHGYAESFYELGQRNIAKLRICGIDNAIPVINGKSYFLGDWELEDNHSGISAFRNLGSKKYCTLYNDGTLEITIAGCNKRSGSTYISENGGIDSFNEFLTIPPEYSGRTKSWYLDEPLHYQTIDGHRYLTGSSIATEPCAYTLHLTTEWTTHVDNIRIVFGEGEPDYFIASE